jgi:serine/threonine protein kinase
VERGSWGEASHPASFASGRYAVRLFLGEGGKKKVYLAHDTALDRNVAFALIKTEGLDDIAKARIVREAYAMARLSYHPNIMQIFDLGSESTTNQPPPRPPAHGRRRRGGPHVKGGTRRRVRVLFVF